MPLSVNDAYDIGRKHERDRIIELLESEILDVGDDGRFLWEPKAIIALIKGENDASE